MNTVRSITTPTLASTQRAFADWRAHRQGRGPTPQPLRLQAVAQLEHHCAFHICRALRLHADALKRWARESTDDARADVVTDADVADGCIALPDAERKQGVVISNETSSHTVIIERPTDFV